jgi:hypothetical protein
MPKPNRKAYTASLDGYWSRRSDEELLKTTFTTNDPENLPCLIHAVPTRGEIPIIEFAYDFRGSKRSLIRCVHCKHTNHRAGFVLKLPDDRRFLVGHNCGRNHYGADFETLKNDFYRAKERALLLKRMQNLTARLPEFNDYLFKFRTHPSLRAFTQFREKFRKTMPRLWGELVIACENRHGNLLIDQQIPDHDAEKRADQAYQRDLAEWLDMSKAQRKNKYHRPQPPEKPILRTITESAGKLPTQTFFGVHAFSKLEFDAITAQFENLSTPYDLDEKSLSAYRHRAKYDPSERSSRKEATSITAYMKLTLWQANTLMDKLEEQIARVSEPLRLFHCPTLEMICRWANAHPKLRCKYVVVGKTIQETDPNGVVRTLALPGEFAIPSAGGIEEFRKAINLADT